MKSRFFLFIMATVMISGCTKKKNEYLLLHSDQLKPLGIVLNDQGVFYKNYHSESKLKSKYPGFAFYCDKNNYASGISFSENDSVSLDSLLNRVELTRNDYYPLLIGNTQGKQSIDNVHVTEEMLLMPVAINMAEAKLSGRADTIVVWFKPTDALQKALPQGIMMEDYLRTRPLQE